MEHRKTSSFVFLSVLAWLSLAALAVPADSFAAATLYVVNGDGPGEGFNDPTPAAPVGGNPGTTLGEQRLNAFQFAADVWGAALDSDVPIYVLGEFDTLPCTLDSGTLGSAGPVEVWSDTPGVEIPGVWYPGPLAEKLAGQDFSPGVEDISAVFNSEVDGPVCFGSRSWYYGLDNQHGDDFDLVTVLLHEIGHGLGVASYLNIRNGRLFDGRPDIYTAHIRDNESGKL